MTDKTRSYSGRFPKVFWVSMLFELFERGAYYTFTPIIVWHAYVNIGVPFWLAAIIFSFIWPIQYGLPILSGALVEKVGYRRQILVAFCILAAAYFFLFSARTGATLILAVVAMGFGIGTYKPLISAIVAKVTTSEDRTYAFGIYYWIVNIAAGFFPIIFAVAEWLGYIDVPVYHIIFLFGAVLVTFNIFIALFLFDDIPRSKDVKTIGDAINNVKISMKDKKFMILVLMVAIFWALYSTQLTGIILIIFGYRWMPEWFTPIIYAIFNPMTIVAIGPFLSKYIEKVESIRVMLAGVLLYIIGLFVLGFGMADWRTLVSGIIIMSVGEFMVAPGFYSFTSKLASKDKVSAYIGSTFIASFIGLPFGAFVLGIIVTLIAEGMRMPYFFMGVCISISLLLFIAFITYYQKWGQEVIERTKRIAEEEEGKKEKVVEADYKEPIIFRLYETKQPIYISMILIPIVLFATFSMGTFTFYGTEKEVEEIPTFDPMKFNAEAGGTFDFSGTLNEGTSAEETITITIGEEELLAEGQFLKGITFTLTWVDEDDFHRAGIGPRTWENQPDEFQLMANMGTNFTQVESGTNPHGGEGTITLEFNFDHELVTSTNGTGEWSIEVTLLNCGNLENPTSPLAYTDSSNDWSLSVATEIYVPK